jgi:RND family efflux transporter MFP subunit
MKKVFVTLVVVVGLGLLGWGIYVKVREAQARKGAGHRQNREGIAVAVEVARVRKAMVRRIGRFTGSLSPRSQFVVAPKIAGRLERITVDVGDPVKPGQLIAEVDDDEHAQQVEEARAELAVAKASVAECESTLRVARRELDRVKTLFQKQMASESDLDEAEARHAASSAKHRVALAEVTRREAALKAAEVRLSYTRIHVTWQNSGAPRVVGERFADEGEMLKANAPIVSILDNNVMMALIDVVERDYPKVKLGQRVVITTDGFPGREFTGRIVRIAPLLKETSRQARVEIEMANPEAVLKPGMFVRARIEFERHEDAIVVPIAALARREGRQGVFLADIAKGKARFVPITAGITDGERVEVIKPPLTGHVVTLGHHLLEDGMAIRLPEGALKETRGEGKGKDRSGKDRPGFDRPSEDRRGEDRPAKGQREEDR